MSEPIKGPSLRTLCGIALIAVPWTLWACSAVPMFLGMGGPYKGEEYALAILWIVVCAVASFFGVRLLLVQRRDP